jgi:nucleoside-diphosphate-sugar epimerase
MPIKGKKIFITGGGGFIGSSIASRLADDNNIVLYDIEFENNSVRHTSLMKNKNVTLFKGDIMDSAALEKAASGSQYVIHAAAVVGVQRVIHNSKKTIDINFSGTSTVLQAASKLKSLQRFVYLSTSEVFGINAYQVDEEASAVFGSNKEPRWSYSIAKIAGEHLVQSYNREDGMPTVIIRPFNIFGPRRLGEHVIKTFMLQALSGKTLTVNNNGSQIRSWCYIDDFTGAVIAALDRKAAVGESFNIGNPRNTVSVYQLALKVRDICKSKSAIKTIPISFTDVELRVPGIAKAQKLLGYEPAYELDDALPATRDWYKKHLLQKSCR